MISIFSTSEGDISTCSVIDWLNFFNAKFQRINLEDIVSFQNIDFKINNTSSKNFLKHSNKDVIFEDKGVSWFRRGKFALLDKSYKKKEKEIEGLYDFQYIELDRIIDFVFKKFKNNYWLNHPDNSIVNKIEALNIAKNYFEIPNTLITNSKQSIIDFLKDNKSIIVKPISEGNQIRYRNLTYWQYTEKIDMELIEELESNIFPALVQKMIEKEFEIRSFFLDGRVFSMAIFSQKDLQTQTDFRNYNQDKPNRMIPYQLADNERNAIQSFMKEMNLNSGSLDFIKSKSGKIVFLEVNPVGQFGMISKNCNYHLEKEIAEFLISKSRSDE